jgi:hypothetical protein
VKFHPKTLENLSLKIQQKAIRSRGDVFGIDMVLEVLVEDLLKLQRKVI